MPRDPRGRVEPTPRAPNKEPTWLPERPTKLVFGQTIVCTTCKGKGKKRGYLCGTCGGYGVIDESPRDHPAS